MKEKTKYIASEILKAIGTTGTIAGIIIFPGMAPMVKWITEMSGEDSYRARRSFKRLEQRGMLKVHLESRQVKLILTPKGKRRFLRNHIASLKIQRQKKWDGRWRIVMFDVPEAERTIRDLVRNKLRSLGFVAIQKSVFIYPYPCFEAIDALRNYYRLAPGTLYIFDAQVREGENVLRKYFHL